MLSTHTDPSRSVARPTGRCRLTLTTTAATAVQSPPSQEPQPSPPFTRAAPRFHFHGHCHRPMLPNHRRGYISPPARLSTPRPSLFHPPTSPPPARLTNTNAAAAHRPTPHTATPTTTVSPLSPYRRRQRPATFSHHGRQQPLRPPPVISGAAYRQLQPHLSPSPPPFPNKTPSRSPLSHLSPPQPLSTPCGCRPSLPDCCQCR